LGERIRELRQEAGLSQRELATRVGVSFPHISKVEANREPASAELLTRIADALAADPDELLVLAGRLPADVEKILRADPTRAFQMLRTMGRADSPSKRPRRTG
jgi:transcriptional regulator with XRE-family HTH domain